MQDTYKVKSFHTLTVLRKDTDPLSPPFTLNANASYLGHDHVTIYGQGNRLIGK